MNTSTLKNTLKEEMKSIIDQTLINDADNAKENINRYIDFISVLNEFEQFRTQLAYSGVLVVKDEEETVQETTSATNNENPIKDTRITQPNLEEEVQPAKNTDTDTDENERQMYRFERKLKNGFLPEINAFVPESIIRNLNLEHNCYVYATEIPTDNDYKRLFKYELAKPSTNPVVPNRTQLNYCKVVKEGSLFLVNESLESGEKIRIDEVPQSIVIKENDISDFDIRVDDLVDIAFPTHRPEDAKVIWKHKFSDVINENKLQEAHKMKEKIKKNNNETKEEPAHTLEGKNILIIGNEPEKANYKEYIEERGGEFSFADAKESLVRLESKVKKCDIVMFLLRVSGHIGMEKAKEFAKKYDKPFLTTFNLGKSSIVKTIEDSGYIERIS